MDPSFLSGGMPLPNLTIAPSSHSDATGGTTAAPWYEGDIVVSYGSGSARSGDRTAPPATSSDGSVIGGAAPGVSAGTWLLAAGILVLGLVWRHVSK